MNILYIAYSCSPDHGSEDRIGWKIPLASAKKNQVTVITKEEHRAKIESYQKEHPELKIAFYYVDIPKIYKKIFRGFSYSGRLNIWQKRAVVLAEQICARKKIQLIHQVTPVEYRSIGDYGRIPGVKYVCGPIGGGEYIPSGLRGYASGHILEEGLRALANSWSRCSLKRKRILSRCDAVLYVNEETKKYLATIPCKSKDYPCITEVGVEEDEIVPMVPQRKAEKKCIFLVAGRLAYRKGHTFLLDALSKIPDDYDYECHIVGNGAELNRLKKKCRRLKLEDRVLFKGRVSFSEMEQIYQSADVLVMPSLRETTGSVLSEGMAKGLPIATINRFGGACLADESCGWLYDGDSKKEYIERLQKLLEECINHPDKVLLKSKNALLVCRRNIWDAKMEYYNKVYTDLL